MRIGYVTLGTNDLERAGRFYDALLAELGWRRSMTDERMLGWSGSSRDTLFSVITPFDGHAATSGNGVMVALDVDTGANVERVHARALALGASDEGQPRDRGSSMGFYGGYFRDLDGNKLVAYCLGWQPDGS